MIVYLSRIKSNFWTCSGISLSDDHFLSKVFVVGAIWRNEWALIGMTAMWFRQFGKCFVRLECLGFCESWWDSWKVPWKRKQRKNVGRGGKRTPLLNKKLWRSLYPSWLACWLCSSCIFTSRPTLGGSRIWSEGENHTIGPLSVV